MVKVHLNEDPDVDKFLDETDLFDEWEHALPEHEYPILVMTVLNDIRNEKIIKSIINAVNEKEISLKDKLETENVSPKKSLHSGEHPFC